jgi:cytochrome P450
MILFPEVQKKAQAEIDAVVGQARLPTLTDRPQLPYVEAVVKEVLRFGQIAPRGVPHRSREDDVHAGYYIPRNSVIVTNIE